MHTFARRFETAPPTTSATSTLREGRSGQRHTAASILHLQRTIGNQAVQRTSEPANKEHNGFGVKSEHLSNDAKESFTNAQKQEPTSVTRFFLSRSPAILPAARSGGPTFAATSTSDALEAEADRLSQRTPMSSPRRRASATLAPVPAPARGGIAAGKLLDANTRARMEHAFGHSFAEVRVHAEEEAARTARHLGARAFTAGADVFFGRGQYQPQSSDGNRLLAHELTHVLQQRYAGLAAGSVIPVQRSAIPKDELLRMRDDIDVKLAKLNLSEVERSRLFKERLQLSKIIGDEELGQDQPGDEPQPPHLARPTTALPHQSEPKLPLSNSPATKSKTPRAVESRPKGMGSSRTKSAKASAKSEAKSSSVPPPTTPYVNHDPQADADEVRVGKKLNELAMERKLGPDVQRVEGRPRGENRVGDYAFILGDGTEVKADLYSPRSRGNAENMARHAETKSGQAEVIVIEFPGGAGPKSLELAHQLADTLIANANTTLKRIIVMAENKLVLNRALNASGRGLLRIQERVEQRRNKLADPGPETPRESPPSRRWERKAPDVRAVEGATGRQHARSNAIGGAGQLILSSQFSSLQNREIDKVYHRLEQLIPRIERLRQQGYQVAVWGEVEVPEVLDIAAGATDTRDASQVVYFVDLWLMPRKLHVAPSSGPTMSGDPSAPIGGDPDQRSKKFPRKGWRFARAIAFTFDPYPDHRR